MSTKTDINSRIIELERNHTSGFYPKRDVAIMRGKGALLWDAEGNEYIDCASGHGVSLLGHCHPAIVEAVSLQSAQLITCPETMPNDKRAELQSQLVEILPAGIERIFLCNSGTEAIEAAIKIARLSTGRTDVIAAMRGFHGRTMGALSATWEKKYREPFVPLIPGFSHVQFNNADALEQEITDQTAAVILEVVQGEGGVHVGSTEYFQRVRELCDTHGALLIIDEVQTGFGRTGKWFACEHVDLKPDLICLGKGIAGGLPMGAVGIGSRVKELPAGAHGSTFGGNPLCCAAALAAIHSYRDEGLIEQSRELGHEFINAIRKIDSPLIRDVRGPGLMIGIDLRIRVTPVLKLLMDEGVIALPAGSTVLRLLPPIVITSGQLQTVVKTIAHALRKYEEESQ